MTADVAQTEIHPDTLKMLKDGIPALRDITAHIDLDPLALYVRESADDMRKMFPGLDDLTLAAICLWEASKAHALLHEYGHESWEKEMIAAALVALDLAWSIRSAS